MPTATKKAATRRPIDPDSVPVDSGVETWRNCTAGIAYITRLGDYGKQMTDLIYGGRAFSLTPAERRLNQSGYATSDLDLFTNGTFQPVSLIDGEPDTEDLRDNPNTLSDGDIEDLLKQRGEAFNQRLAEITSETALARVMTMAREPRYEATLAQYETIKLRQLALKGDPIDTAPTQPADPNMGSIPRAHTPR